MRPQAEQIAVGGGGNLSEVRQSFGGVTVRKGLRVGDPPKLPEQFHRGDNLRGAGILSTEGSEEFRALGGGRLREGVVDDDRLFAFADIGPYGLA